MLTLSAFIQANNMHNVLLSRFDLKIHPMFAPDLFEFNRSKSGFNATYFIGHKAYGDSSDGPLTFYRAVGGFVSLSSDSAMKIKFELTLSQFCVLEQRFNSWFSVLLKDSDDYQSECKEVYPKWAVFKFLRRSPCGYCLNLTFNKEPSAQLVMAITNLMVYLGYPLKKSVDKDPCLIREQQARGAIKRHLFNECYQ